MLYVCTSIAQIRALGINQQEERYSCSHQGDSSNASTAAFFLLILAPANKATPAHARAVVATLAHDEVLLRTAVMVITTAFIAQRCEERRVTKKISEGCSTSCARVLEKGSLWECWITRSHGKAEGRHCLATPTTKASSPALGTNKTENRGQHQEHGMGGGDSKPVASSASRRRKKESPLLSTKV